MLINCWCTGKQSSTGTTTSF